MPNLFVPNKAPEVYFDAYAFNIDHMITYSPSNLRALLYCLFIARGTNLEFFQLFATKWNLTYNLRDLRTGILVHCTTAPQ